MQGHKDRAGRLGQCSGMSPDAVDEKRNRSRRFSARRSGSAASR